MILMVNLSSFRRDLWQAFVNQSSRSASSNCCQILSQMLLLCFPKGVAAPPLDSRSQGFHPLDPTPHPLHPLSNKWRGGTASRAVVGCPVNGQRESDVSLPPFAVPERRRRPQYGAPGMAEDVRCRCFLAAALPCILLLHCWHCVGAAPSPARCPELRRRVERERGGRVSGRGEVCWAKQSSTHNAGCSSPRYGSAGSVPLAMALI